LPENLASESFAISSILFDPVIARPFDWSPRVCQCWHKSKQRCGLPALSHCGIFWGSPDMGPTSARRGAKHPASYVSSSASWHIVARRLRVPWTFKVFRFVGIQWPEGCILAYSGKKAASALDLGVFRCRWASQPRGFSGGLSSSNVNEGTGVPVFRHSTVWCIVEVCIGNY